MLSPLVMYRLPCESQAAEAPAWQQEYTDCSQCMMTFSEPGTIVFVAGSYVKRDRRRSPM